MDQLSHKRYPHLGYLLCGKKTYPHTTVNFHTGGTLGSMADLCHFNASPFQFFDRIFWFVGAKCPFSQHQQQNCFLQGVAFRVWYSNQLHEVFVSIVERATELAGATDVVTFLLTFCSNSFTYFFKAVNSESVLFSLGCCVVAGLA